MTEDKKMQDNSIEDTLSSIKNIVENEVDTSSEAVIDLTETEMVSTSDKSTEELIDIKSFDQTGELNKADDDAALVAKAQNGDDNAIEAFSKSLTGETTTPEPAAEAEPAGQDDIDALLNNLGQVGEQANEDLTSKADMLEEASKTYVGKDFSESEEFAEEGEEEIESDAPQQDASFEDIAAAMSAQSAPEQTQTQETNTMANEQLVKDLENKVTSRVALKAVPAASGLQVGFPVEVLAEALRPMVAGWVEENLPTIVEKLVKEELSKLADK